ncbi:MAG: aldehyde dehydrogenase [Chitinophagaceae bacterium]|nr:aldehyde dehydrogenase [Chitinophagaceae bacterium]
MDISASLAQTRLYFESGATRSFSFRKHQLEKLRTALLQHEEEIYDALYADLKKSKEEAYVTELGLVLAEIRHVLKHLRQWMKPESVPGGWVNFPSNGKIYKDPLGVVLLIAPWNYPLQLSLMPLIGAIAAGNCVVVKPSEIAPRTARLVDKMIAAVFEKEFVSVVHGEGEVVIPKLLEDFRFDHIFYTGNGRVGKIIYSQAAEKLIPVTLELGGKSPGIVEADARIAVAAKRIVFGKFLNAGQTCIAPDYVLTHCSVKDRLVEEMRNTIRLFYKEAAADSYDYSSVINESRFDKLVSYLQQGNILFGGAHDRARLYIEPTIMEIKSPEAPVMEEEIFGPILPVLSFEKREEAMAIVNRNANPLAFYLFTGNKHTEKEWIESISFGGGCINNTLVHFMSPEMPFGGVGNSGIGSYHGKFSFMNFSRRKPVLKTAQWFDPSMRYPPFKGKLRWFKRLIR